MIDSTASLDCRIDAFVIVRSHKEHGMPRCAPEPRKFGQHSRRHELKDVSLCLVELRVSIKNKAVDLIEEDDDIRLLCQNIEDGFRFRLDLSLTTRDKIARANLKKPS